MKRWFLQGTRRFYLLEVEAGPKGYKMADIDVRVRIKSLGKKKATLICPDNTLYWSQEQLDSADGFETDRDMIWALALKQQRAAVEAMFSGQRTAARATTEDTGDDDVDLDD